MGKVVGIDLGTTYCAVAALDERGRPFTVPNRDGDVLTPSAIYNDTTIWTSIATDGTRTLFGDASFENGLLQIQLVREVPEAMKPRRIAINGTAAHTIEQKKAA